jgi:hypothetical protein
MFDARSIRRGKENVPRKLIIYGESKIGKSTLAAAAPDSLLIALEDRVRHIDTSKTEVLKNFEEVMEVFEYLMSGTQYRTVVIDSVDWLQPLLHEYICRKKNFKSLYDDNNKETNFGRGIKIHACDGWKMFLQNCDLLRIEQNMNIILVAHSMIEKISPPDSDAFDRYTLSKLDKSETAILLEWCDICAFYNREKVIKKEDAGFGKKQGKALNVDGNRVLNLQATSPAWISGNSYDLPDCIVTIEDAPEIMKFILNSEGEENKKETKKKKGEN